MRDSLLWAAFLSAVIVDKHPTVGGLMGLAVLTVIVTLVVRRIWSEEQ